MNETEKKSNTPFVLVLTGIILFAVLGLLGGSLLKQPSSSPSSSTFPTSRTTPVPAAMWTHTAWVRVNDEQGVPMGTNANVWVDAFRTDLKVNCTIPRGQTVEVSTQRVINDSIRVKYGSCEGWIGVVQLDKITPKN